MKCQYVSLKIHFINHINNCLTFVYFQLEKAEWIGLMPFEAVQKLKKIEQEKFNESIKPWKLKFTEELFEKLEKLKLEGKPLIEETKEK